jgi:hypothetical protein
VLHIMAVTQLPHDERARRIFDDARHRGHTKKEPSDAAEPGAQVS